MRVAVAVSGGADSLYALWRIKAEHEVLALHALLTPDAAPPPGLATACGRLGVPLHCVDLRAAFAEQVMQPFARAYLNGLTPNPCGACNAAIKFGLLFDHARHLGMERLATGHYARLVQHPRYGLALGKATDATRDQRYFLALVPADRLYRAMFPLDTVNKSTVRETLDREGLAVPLPHDSQDICFVPKGDCGESVARLAATHNLSLPPGGPILLNDHGNERRVGTHRGLWRATEGQRKGLGVAWKEPLYVIGKDRTRNALMLGTAAALTVTGCTVRAINLLVNPALWPPVVWARTRYREQPALASVRFSGECLAVDFAAPHTRTAPGQLITLEDRDGVLLAGGVLEANEVLDGR